MHMKGKKAKMCVFDEFLPTFCGQKVGSVFRQETQDFHFRSLYNSTLRLVKNKLDAYPIARGLISWTLSAGGLLLQESEDAGGL